jgi:hypothetical protein
MFRSTFLGGGELFCTQVQKYVKPKAISRQNQLLTQQQNWKKSFSSPRAASVIWDVAGGGLFLQWPLANTLIVSIRNAHVARNWYE